MDGYLQDDRPPWYKTDRGWQNLFTLTCVPFALIVAHFFSSGTAALLTGSIINLYVVISLKWSLRTKTWFWSVISIFIVAHLLCVLFVNLQLPEGPAITYALPVVAIDCGLMLLVLSMVERRISRLPGR